MKLNRIKNYKYCYGCGVCAMSCPNDAIKIIINRQGFFTPKIDKNNCINCGICQRVCSFSDDNLSINNQPLEAYAGWSKDKITREVCSSGGIIFELLKNHISKGYRICSSRYNSSKQIAEHYIAEEPTQLIESIGSKYIQSFTLDAYKYIHNQKNNYIIVGTPCQIDSFRRYAKLFNREKDFVFIDFFCHGVPSMNMWKKYLNHVNKNGISKIEFVSWRGKQNGWSDSWIMSIDDNIGKIKDTNKLLDTIKNCKYQSARSRYDSFYYLFLSNSCLNKACYKNCKFKCDKSSADIRIGDLWGSLYSDNNEGVNAIVTYTNIGQQLITEIDSKCHFEKHDFSVITEGQMKNSPKISINYYICNIGLKLPILGINTIKKVLLIIDILRNKLSKQ